MNEECFSLGGGSRFKGILKEKKYRIPTPKSKDFFVFGVPSRSRLPRRKKRDSGSYKREKESQKSRNYIWSEAVRILTVLLLANWKERNQDLRQQASISLQLSSLAGVGKYMLIVWILPPNPSNHIWPIRKAPHGFHSSHFLYSEWTQSLRQLIYNNTDLLNFVNHGE